MEIDLSTVLDAWALVAFLDDQPAATKVEAVLLDGSAVACSINLGEVLYRQIRAFGQSFADRGINALRQEMKVVEPSWDIVSAAAGIKAQGGLSDADAFCIATAMHLEAPLWTGDPEIIELGGDLAFEVVDLRP